MSWKKHLVHIPKNQRLEQVVAAQRQYAGEPAASASKFTSYLPEVYAGQPNRVERYVQYDNMDLDSEISTALNTIADFCTQTEEQNPLPFMIEWFENGTEVEVEVLKTAMQSWIKRNNFQSEVWKIFRDTLKYGDQFFIRDPETLKWLWIDPANVVKISVDESKGRQPVSYTIKNLSFYLQNSAATKPVVGSSPMTQGPAFAGATVGGLGSVSSQSMFSLGNSHGKFAHNETLYEIDAKHVVHLSMATSSDINWPFGTSILEAVYKTYKQKELLEDAILIYRVQRAPERRVFYIDVGNTPPTKAMPYIEKVKNQIQQKRMPSRMGGGNSIVDSAYNPMSMLDDYYLAVSSDGRGSKIETLPGGESIGDIADLNYFNTKLIRGLGVPSSYLPQGNDDGGQGWSDGKVGTAYIQEFRFGKYCERLQRQLQHIFDEEFKRFIEHKGLTIDPNQFQLMFNPPQNFSRYRQIELDSAQISVFTQLSDIPYFSKRFILKRFLNLSEDEVIENERMWAEENGDMVESQIGFNPNKDGGSTGLPGMSSVGMGTTSSPFDSDTGGDFDTGGDEGFGDFGGEESGGEESETL
jgi:hypothetical protein